MNEDLKDKLSSATWILRRALDCELTDPHSAMVAAQEILWFVLASDAGQKPPPLARDVLALIARADVDFDLHEATAPTAVQ